LPQKYRNPNFNKKSFPRDYVKKLKQEFNRKKQAINDSYQAQHLTDELPKKIRPKSILINTSSVLVHDKINSLVVLEKQRDKIYRQQD